MAESGIDIAQFLKEVPLFSALPAEDLARVAAIGVQRRYSADETVFKEGDRGDQMFVVIWGQVHIQRRAEDGEIVTLTTLGPKQHFGEMALFDDVSRSASAKIYHKSALLLSIERGAFLDLLRGHAEIAMHIIAWQNQRLRDLSEKIVEVDHAARKHAPSLAETVLKEYPHPIAIVFQEMDTAADPASKLRRLLELGEVILLYASSLARSAYLSGGATDPGYDIEILNGQASCTLGYMHRLIRMAVDGFERTNAPGLPAALTEWFTQKKGNKKRIAIIFEEITELRNSIKHGSEAALNEEACAEHLKKVLPLALELLESLQFLLDYPLVFIQNMGFADGVFQYSCQICKGAFRTFHSESFDYPQPLETQRLYVVDKARRHAWPLFPWLGLYRCDSCGDRDIFFTTLWSAKRLSCIEFGRGHRLSPKDVAASVARLEAALEGRVKGTEFERR